MVEFEIFDLILLFKKILGLFKSAKTKNLLLPNVICGEQEVKELKHNSLLQIYLLIAVVALGALFTYLKNTGNATKKATQIRYSIPLMCV